MLPENCPICGEKMEKGYIFATGHEIRWTKYERGWLSKSDALKQGILRAPKIESYRCQNCKSLIQLWRRKGKRVNLL